MNTHDSIRTLLSEAWTLLTAYDPQGIYPSSRTRLEDQIDKALQDMRRVLDDIAVDPYGLPQKADLPSNRFFEIYDILYRSQNRSCEELVQELLKGDRIRDGFYNRGAFPDGKGGYFIDDFGMEGQWFFQVRTRDRLTNRWIVRTIDAVARVLYSENARGAGGKVVFVDSLDQIRSEALHPGGQVAIQSSSRSIFVTPSFCKFSRAEQEDHLRLLLNTQRMVPFYESDRTGLLTIAPSRRTVLRADQPDAWLVFIAAVRPNRAADYANHRFNSRVRAHVQGLQSQRFDVAFAAVEDQQSFGDFEESYRRRPTDVVLFSLYQHRQEDLERIHALATRLRIINPLVFLVVEGPAAILFKQFLCLLPEINMLIRGEAQGITETLLALKRKGAGLTGRDILNLSDRIPTGLFIRSASGPPDSYEDIGVISHADRSSVDQSPELIHPNRELSVEWLCQRGCPEKCTFCANDEGQYIKKRSIPAEARTDWMVERLRLEIIPTKRPDPETLREVLRAQSTSPDLLSRQFSLYSDSFIGCSKVLITLLGQNETANRKDIILWARQIEALGLQKYFRIKIADAAVRSFEKRSSGADKFPVVDEELLRALRTAGVQFIGMGIENLQLDILKSLNKRYNADLPIAVVKGLLEAGFDPGSIRGNIIAATPDSTMAVAHASCLLLYASPIYNSILFRFGNGWGHARSPRIYTHGSSQWSSLSVMRNPERADFTNPAAAVSLEGTEAILRFEDFFVPRNAPEYSIQSEVSRIRSIDERIPIWLTEFLYPTFYRHHIVQWFDEYLTDDDVEQAMHELAKDDESRQVASFVRIFEHYRAQMPRLPLIHLIRHIKADMVAQELFSFEDFSVVLEEIPDLPHLFHEAHITRTFEAGDAFLLPGSFAPDRALEMFANAGMYAQQVLLSARDETTGALGTREEIRRHYEKRRDEARKRTYRLMAYPDVLQIEWLGTVYAMDSDQELFKRVVERMNAATMDVSAAVESLICERLELQGDEYGRLFKASRKPSNLHLFAEAGVLRRLKEGGRVAEQLRRFLGEERDPLLVKVIQSNLTNFARHKELPS